MNHEQLMTAIRNAEFKYRILKQLARDKANALLSIEDRQLRKELETVVLHVNREVEKVENKLSELYKLR